MMTTVTPYLPKVGIIQAREWMNGGKPAFVKAHERRPNECPNCQGVGFVSLLLIDSGPYNSFVPAGKNKVVTWFDGNDQNGRGWYLINETLCFVCPECNGETGRYAVKDSEYMELEVVAIKMQAHKPIIEALAEKMSVKRQRFSNHAGAASGEVDTSVVNNATKGESRMGLEKADWMTVDNLDAPLLAGEDD